MIRRAKEKDIDIIVELSIKFHQYFDEIYGKELNPVITSKKDVLNALKAGFNNDKHDIFVIEVKNDVIGFGDVWTYPEFVHSGNSAYIQNLFILKQYRGKGWGNKMIKLFLKIAKERKARAIHMTTSKKNLNAINLYKKIGIVDEGILLEKYLQ